MKLNKKDGLNVVPFIDIMLVLLAIVLSISTFIAQGKIQVNLPKAPNATKSTQNDIKKVTILVNSDNELYIDDNVTTPQELSLKLKDILKEDTLVVIKNDKDSKFDMFIKVIDVLKELKHENSQLSPKQNKNGNLIGFFVSFLVHIGFLYLFLHIPKIEAVSDSVLEMDIAAFDAKTSESVATSQDIPEIPDEILETPDDEEQEEVEEDVEPVENIEVDEFAEVVKPEPKPEPKKKPEKKKKKQKQKIAAPPKPKALVKGPEQSGDLAAAVGPKNNEPIRLASGGGNPSLWGAILAHIKAHKNYPKIAKRLRQQGTVHVEFLLKSDGTTSGIKIVKSSGFQSLDEAALNTVKKASSKFPKPDKDYILTVPIVYSINVR